MLCRCGNLKKPGHLYCTPCNSARKAIYRAANRDKERKAQALYYKNNKERINKQSSEWMRKNKIRFNKRRNEWCKENREKVENWQRRRNSLLNQPISKHYKAEIASFYSSRPKNMTVDHIIPLGHENVSGLHVPWNLQYLTRSENSKKYRSFDGTRDNNTWRSR